MATQRRRAHCQGRRERRSIAGAAQTRWMCFAQLARWGDCGRRDSCMYGRTAAIPLPSTMKNGFCMMSICQFVVGYHEAHKPQKVIDCYARPDIRLVIALIDFDMTSPSGRVLKQGVNADSLKQTDQGHYRQANVNFQKYLIRFITN
jgi:hypothetical protein